MATRDPVRRVFAYISRLLPHRPPRNFGLFESLRYVHSGALDWTVRHLQIINELERLRAWNSERPLAILDFGGGDGSLGAFLADYGLASDYAVTLADIDANALQVAFHDAPVQRIVHIDSKPPLPFPDGSFDMVVSSDVFEHIPSELRRAWADELLRVARRAIVHTMPYDDGARFTSVEADRAFAQWHLEAFGVEERWTSQHLAYQVPGGADAEILFGASQVRGTMNSNVWLAAIKREFTPAWPVLRVIRKLRNVVEFQRRGSLPPYKGCVMVLIKASGGRPDERLAHSAPHAKCQTAPGR